MKILGFLVCVWMLAGVVGAEVAPRLELRPSESVLVSGALVVAAPVTTTALRLDQPLLK